MSVEELEEDKNELLHECEYLWDEKEKLRVQLAQQRTYTNSLSESFTNMSTHIVNYLSKKVFY